MTRPSGITNRSTGNDTKSSSGQGLFGLSRWSNKSAEQAWTPMDDVDIVDS